MNTEVSAGGVIVKKRGDEWYVLVIHDLKNQLTFPKGNVEEGESEEETAIREIREEVGITKLKTIKKLPVITYFYTRGGLINKSVHYFVFLAIEDEKPVAQTNEGIHDPTWIPLKKAQKDIGYPKTNKDVLLWTLHALQTFKN